MYSTFSRAVDEALSGDEARREREWAQRELAKRLCEQAVVPVVTETPEEPVEQPEEPLAESVKKPYTGKKRGQPSKADLEARRAAAEQNGAA